MNWIEIYLAKVDANLFNLYVISWAYMWSGGVGTQILSN